MNNKAWAKLVKQNKPEPKTPKHFTEPEFLSLVSMPAQLTPRTLKVIFSSLFTDIPLEKYDSDIELNLNDKFISIRFKDGGVNSGRKI